jgi:aldose 1-epimerase
VQTSGSHLRAGDLEATFLPDLGMVCVSLRHRAEELLGLVDELDRYERQGSTLGIPLLHPWANRLAGFRYAAGGTEVLLDSRSPLLHFDEHGLPIHGIPGARLAWKVVDAHGDFVRAVLDWNTDDLLAVFPYPHTLEMTVRLSPSDLEIETALAPIGKVPVPVSFGFHPYLALPGTARAEWIVELPAMARLVLDESGIPTGDEKPFPGLHGGLDRDYDDGFAGLPAQPQFAVAGGGRRVEVAFLRGYCYAQVFAPPDKPFICFEPMTAPTNALVSGRGLALVTPGERYEAAVRIAVEPTV